MRSIPPSSKAPRASPPPARGFFEEYEIRDGAVYGRVALNQHGKDRITAREYIYYSPALLHDPEGVILGISSVGLTNKHNLDLPALNRQTSKEPTMDPTIAQALGLADNATAQDAVTAIQKLSGDLQTSLNREADPTKFVPVETHQLALNRAQTAETTLAELKTAETTREAETLVDGAIEGGKIAPANRDHYLALCRQEGGMATVKTLLETAPKVLTEQSPAGDPNANTPLTEAELSVCRQLGQDPEAFLKSKKAEQAAT